MSRKTQFIVLVVLLVLLAVVWGANWGAASGGVVAFLGPERVDRFVVQNPTLRLELLSEIRKFEYAGMRRNIFNFGALPVERPPALPQPVNPEPVGPAPEPKPVEVAWVPPFKFYGYVVDSRTGRRRGFFTNGDDIWVLAEGETVPRRFKLVSLSATRAEVEEVNSGKRATLALDESAAPSGG